MLFLTLLMKRRIGGYTGDCGGGTTASYWYGDLQYLKATH